MTPTEHEQDVAVIATIRTDVEYIKKAVDEIKPFCIKVTQHEEKIDILEKVFGYAGWVGGMVMLALIAVVLGHLFAR